MVHTLKTVGDLLELCKRLPEDMELRELCLKYSHKLSRLESCDSSEIRVSIEPASIVDETAVMKLLSTSLNIDWRKRN